MYLENTLELVDVKSTENNRKLLVDFTEDAPKILNSGQEFLKQRVLQEQKPKVVKPKAQQSLKF